MFKLPHLIELNNQQQFRIIPSVYPPINFFEDLVDPAEMEILWQIEMLTNERLRQEAGDIFLVAAEDRVSGPGSSVVMAAFTHLSKPTRFSNGRYGVYYAGLSQETAIRETVYHREIFLRATNQPPTELTMRMYQGFIQKPLHDVRRKAFNSLHDRDNYTATQLFGENARNANSAGLIYNSVRHAKGTCIAAFKPTTISIPSKISHLKYIWNGENITEVLATQPILKL